VTSPLTIGLIGRTMILFTCTSNAGLPTKACQSKVRLQNSGLSPTSPRCRGEVGWTRSSPPALADANLATGGNALMPCQPCLGLVTMRDHARYYILPLFLRSILDLQYSLQILIFGIKTLRTGTKKDQLHYQFFSQHSKPAQCLSNQSSLSPPSPSPVSPLLSSALVNKTRSVSLARKVLSASAPLSAVQTASRRAASLSAVALTATSLSSLAVRSATPFLISSISTTFCDVVQGADGWLILIDSA
jgi:hypothetical protein